MKKVILFSWLFVSFLYADVDNTILLQQKVNEQSEKIDVMKSIVEGFNDRLQSLEDIGRDNQTQKEAIENNNRLIKDLAKMIDDLDSKCVKKDELQALLSKYQNIDSSSQNTAANSKDKLLDSAISSFRNGDYDKAKANFLVLDKEGYKTAIADYYLGEIAYYSKNYKDALFYYKKSAKLDSEATYLDTLLLHSGIALENSDQKAEAKKFYETVIDKYPQKSSAKIAKIRLDGI